LTGPSLVTPIIKEDKNESVERENKAVTQKQVVVLPVDHGAASSAAALTDDREKVSFAFLS
jgi:hypothetical protein